MSNQSAPQSFHHLSPAAIDERVARFEDDRGFRSLFLRAGMAGLVVLFGIGLTLTVVGAIVGVPMILAGVVLIGKSGIEAIRRGLRGIRSPLWQGTSLAANSWANVRHRAVNKHFRGRCPICGEFAALRDTSGKPVPDETVCLACSARLDRERGVGVLGEWRLVAGDDERIGERKAVTEWADELCERETDRAAAENA